MQPYNFFSNKLNSITSNIVPKECSCSLDTILSSEHQKKIMQSIQELHQVTNNPSQVIKKIVQEFPEINTMQAEICSADKICFNAQVVNPVFVLNDALVVSDNYISFKKESLDSRILSTLPKIYSSKSNQHQEMVAFIHQIPQELSKNYTISWHDKNQIIFKPHENEYMSYVVSTSLIPSLELLQDCRELYNQNSKKGFKKNNKTMVEYDIRFKNQIIVKSGGKYG